jgi:hypothetical protein
MAEAYREMMPSFIIGPPLKIFRDIIVGLDKLITATWDSGMSCKVNMSVSSAVQDLRRFATGARYPEYLQIQSPNR